MRVALWDLFLKFNPFTSKLRQARGLRGEIQRDVWPKSKRRLLAEFSSDALELWSFQLKVGTLSLASRGQCMHKKLEVLSRALRPTLKQ